MTRCVPACPAPACSTRAPARRHYCPGPVVQQQVQCPATTVCKKVWVPHEECRVVKRVPRWCASRSAPRCRCRCAGRWPAPRCGPARRPSAAWCRNSTSATRPAPAATRCREEKVCQMPYTTCRMVPEQHVRYETRHALLHGARDARPLRSATRPAGWCPSSTCGW